MKKSVKIITVVLMIGIVTFAGFKNWNHYVIKEIEEREAKVNMDNITLITLTINGKVLNGYLNDSKPAQSFKNQLPMTVTASDWSMGSEKDFCGSQINVEYSKSDVQTGFKNGDIVYYVEHDSNEFVIFVSGEEDSAMFGGNVVMGKITDDLDYLKKLHGTVTIEIKINEN